jgi:hypothetical protein
VPSAEAGNRNDSEEFFRIKIYSGRFQVFFCSRPPAVLAHCAEMAALKVNRSSFSPLRSADPDMAR